jgi:hypothetical protein
VKLGQHGKVLARQNAGRVLGAGQRIEADHLRDPPGRKDQRLGEHGGLEPGFAISHEFGETVQKAISQSGVFAAADLSLRTVTYLNEKILSGIVGKQFHLSLPRADRAVIRWPGSGMGSRARLKIPF